MSSFPQDVYARNLLSHRGYPLWTPEPNIELPDTYQREGLKIGDVGVVVPEEGSFDVFFNITLPREHPLHAADGVPDNFAQVKLRREDYRVAPDAESPGRVLSSSTVECTVSCIDPFDLDGRPCKLTDHEFNLRRNQGAMLILPQGAERHRLAKEMMLLDTVIHNAVDWYRFAREKLYRNIRDDALYLITGIHKAQSWSLASYENTGTSAARCRMMQLPNGGFILAARSTWETVRPLEWRIGPREPIGIPNQSVFITGFRIAVKGLLQLKRVSVKVDYCKRTLATRLVGFGTSSINPLGRSRPSQSPEATKKSAVEHGSFVDENEDENEDEDEDVTVERIPHILQPFHPSDIITRYLLAKESTANIAIVHDSQWINLLERGILKQEDLVHEGRLEAAVSCEYHVVTKDGAVYLQSISPDETRLNQPALGAATMEKIYHVDTQIGQHSRGLPLDIDGASDGEITDLTASQPSAPAGMGFDALVETTLAGFGVPKRSSTPEPWTRRLADDGMSYFYLNKLTGQVSWTLPETESSAKKGRARALTNSSTASSDVFSSHDEADQITRSRSDSAAQQDRGMRARRQSTSEHISDSDDSAVYSSSDPDISPSTSRSSQNGQQDQPAPIVQRNPALELTAAERIAQSLQQSLASPPPELVSDLSHIARDAVASVVQKNQSLTGISRRSEHAHALDNLIRSVVIAVRNLLYISAPGHIPNQLIPRDARDQRETTAAQTLLKPAQRKVTATLSKLVLSARAMEYDSGPPAQEAASRIESDAEELDRAIVAFVIEVQRYHNEQQQTTIGAKRVQGCFSVVHLGLGLVGAGHGGSWKGFGWVPMDDTEEFPQTVLSSNAFSEFKTHMVSVQAKFGSLHAALRNRVYESYQRVWMASKGVLTELLTLLLFVSNLHIARHVDIDGSCSESAEEGNRALYTQTVDKARLLSRTLESAVQALYDDASTMLLTTQRILPGSSRRASQESDYHYYDYLDAIAASIESNLQFLLRTLDALLSVGHDQADIAEADHKGAIDSRVPRLSIMDSHYNVRPILNPADPESEDIVDVEVAFDAAGSKKRTIQPDRVPSLHLQSQISDNTSTLEDLSYARSITSSDYTMSEHTLVSSERQIKGLSMSNTISFNDDESTISPTTSIAQKIQKIFGDDAPEYIINAKPWYLWQDYTKDDMVIDVDGSVRAGTVPALVERLTSHETGDPTFIATFLMTYKSFTTIDELFVLLVQRFYIQPPHNLTPTELEEWKKLKQHIIQMRVLNTFKAMVIDDDFLEKEDMYILDRMKEFLLQDAVSKIAISKQLVILIDRACAGELKKTITPNLVSPPTSIVPKAGKRVKLLDVDPLELARQLTILESQLYQKIRPMECLSRSRERGTDHNDNIARVIQTSNRIANWVADTVLSYEDSRKRAAILKHFILVADCCRSLHNYSTMAAIVSGLNSPPIRQLKRSWEQLNLRHMTQLNACEMTIDSGKNFMNYRSTLAKVAPPCVPFIGVFLTTLTLIQKGSKDTLESNLVNFRKRQKAIEVIQDVRRWQTLPHHFHPLSAVQIYIEESLGKFSDQVDVGDIFWNLSLEREPREREDEKMTRLLQESGFL